jgi:phage terminase large subunit-like protein
MLMFGLRLGDDPRVVVTAQADQDHSRIDRRSHDGHHTRLDLRQSVQLSASVSRADHQEIRGTRLGRQELNAELLDDGNANRRPRKATDASHEMLHARAAGPDWQFTEINGRFYATAG